MRQFTNSASSSVSTLFTMSHHLEVVSGGTWRDAGIPGVVLLRLFLIFFARWGPSHHSQRPSRFFDSYVKKHKERKSAQRFWIFRGGGE